VQGPVARPKAVPETDTASDAITQAELRDHKYFLASDYLGGRRLDEGGDAHALAEHPETTRRGRRLTYQFLHA